jgi:hypothetical protein
MAPNISRSAGCSAPPPWLTAKTTTSVDPSSATSQNPFDGRS